MSYDGEIIGIEYLHRDTQSSTRTLEWIISSILSKTAKIHTKAEAFNISRRNLHVDSKRHLNSPHPGENTPGSLYLLLPLNAATKTILGIYNPPVMIF